MTRAPTEMEARVARAVCGSSEENISYCKPERVRGCVGCLSIARAAIRAMREPTNEVIEAFRNCPTADESGYIYPSHAWIAGIDAASPQDK